MFTYSIFLILNDNDNNSKHENWKWNWVKQNITTTWNVHQQALIQVFGNLKQYITKLWTHWTDVSYKENFAAQFVCSFSSPLIIYRLIVYNNIVIFIDSAGSNLAGDTWANNWCSEIISHLNTKMPSLLTGLSRQCWNEVKYSHREFIFKELLTMGYN